MGHAVRRVQRQGVVMELAKVRLRDDLDWLVPILRDRCRQEQDWALSRGQRWAYTAKALLVILLRRDRECRYNFDSVTVASTGFHSTFSLDFGSGEDWIDLVVGRGLFRGWWFGTRTNGYP